uniref:hypothetical protein n=1 Tax=Flavonifractor plautii TaxID=292800 RepID=UPI003D7CDB71
MTLKSVRTSNPSVARRDGSFWPEKNSLRSSGPPYLRIFQFLNFRAFLPPLFDPFLRVGDLKPLKSLDLD